jgi:hypothetical protein
VLQKLNNHFFLRAVNSPPFIIVGMHRSGTTLLTQILQRLGVFMGKHLTNNAESIFFQNLNKEALDILGCNWRCLDFLPDIAEMYSHYQWLRKRMSKRVTRSLVAEHFGWHALQLLGKKPVVWGWKDPRNCLVLPIYRQIFPKATILNILRDGRDVALSLLMREMKREKNNRIFDKYKKIQRFESYFRLWIDYVNRTNQSLNHFKKVYTVRYENILKNPRGEIDKLIQNLNIQTNTSSQEVSLVVNTSSKKNFVTQELSWLNNLDLDKVLLEELGYD